MHSPFDPRLGCETRQESAHIAGVDATAEPLASADRAEERLPPVQAEPFAPLKPALHERLGGSIERNRARAVALAMPHPDGAVPQVKVAGTQVECLTHSQSGPEQDGNQGGVPDTARPPAAGADQRHHLNRCEHFAGMGVVVGNGV